MIFKKTVSYVKKRPGFVILLILLFFLNIASLKPDFYLIGWDNFSSYFNLKTNLFRTFFSSWREYRGLGVPSDSEVVDLFRQIFFLLFSPFLKENLLEQVYSLFCLNAGVLGMYYFAWKLLKRTFSKEKHRYLDSAAFVASFFYLFNLNTLATFYFPMTMYINRFAALPILFYVFFKIIEEKTFGIKSWVLMVLVALFTATSYLTATIFVAFLLFVFIFGLFLGNKNRLILVCLLFVSLNLFWLLPFANYTLEKAEIIKLAPSFFNANESQLNKPNSFYAPTRLLTLYPNFLDTKITDIAEGNFHFLYPQIHLYNQKLGRSILLLFPLFYLGGVILILTKFRKKIFLWIPITILLTFFLVGKEFTPLGPVYNFVERIIPYFDILFRFADTKFNIFLAFAGGISGGLVIVFLFDFFHKLNKKYRSFVKVLSFLILIPYVLIFSPLFAGNLIGSFMYNKVPEGYFEIAEIINSDKENFRVLHLPFNRAGYWKFYQWGMPGSSFLNFMIDKPFIDRTFEPASMENAYLHQAIFQLIENAQDIEQSQDLNQRSLEFYRLLEKTGVKYIIWDETVANSVYGRGVNYWGDFNAYDARTVLESLMANEFIKKTAAYQLNILDYLNLYPITYPLNEKTVNRLVKNPFYSIELYEMKNYDSKFYFAREAVSIDANLNNLLATDLILNNQNYIQDANGQIDSFFPFLRHDAPLLKNESEITFKFSETLSDLEHYLVEPEQKNIEETSHYIEVFAHSDEDNLIISFYRLPIPVFQNEKTSEFVGQIKMPLTQIRSFLEAKSDLENYFSDWWMLPFGDVSSLRLNLDGYIFPLPAKLDSKDKNVATIISSGNEIEVELLAKFESTLVDLLKFQLTENPNCFEDKLEDYEYSLTHFSEKLLLQSKNGSTCIVKNITNDLNNETEHMEVKLSLEAKEQDLDKQYVNNLEWSVKPILKKFVLSYPKPNLLRVCVRGQNTEKCFNKHQVLRLENKQLVTVPLEEPVKQIYEPLILLAINNLTYQNQEVTINSLILDQFKTLEKTKFSLKPLKPFYEISFNNKQKITLQIPQALSKESFYFDKDKDGFYLSNQPCQEEPNSYRTFRLIDGRWVSFFNNCSNLASIKNNFDSRHFYLWNIDYHLFSGKYPKYVLDDGFRLYKNNYLSLNQGYPDIIGFKDLQKPEGFWTRLAGPLYQKSLQSKFENAVLQSAYTFIYPQPELKDEEAKNYTLHHDSENEAMLSLASFDLIELPNVWKNLVIKEANGLNQYNLPQKVEYKQILPSLWQVDFQSKLNNEPLLLVFNEAYDQQWRIFDSVFNFFLGKQKGNTRHLKFNGYANAWEINGQGKQKVYIFYAPEMLSWLGWSLTLATIVCGFFVFKFWNLRSKR